MITYIIAIKGIDSNMEYLSDTYSIRHWKKDLSKIWNIIEIVEYIISIHIKL